MKIGLDGGDPVTSGAAGPTQPGNGLDPVAAERLPRRGRFSGKPGEARGGMRDDRNVAETRPLPAYA